MHRLLVTVSLWVLAGCASVRYDQAQTGDTNIHLQLKNVEVLALLEDPSADIEQYDYDYSEFTIKPPKPGATDSYSTTSKPGSQTSTTSQSAGNITSSSETPLLGPTPVPVSEDAVSSVVADTAASVTAAPVTAAPGKRARRCGAGFYRDTLGRCRRIRRPNLQMMVNLSRGKPANGVSD